MGRVVIRTIDEARTAAFPALAGVSVSGDVQTKAIVAKDKRPILLWQHTLAPGAEITWNAPPVGHLAYVFEGAGEGNGRKLATEDAFMVAHGGKGTLRAGPGPMTVLHFHRPDDYGTPSNRAGGCCHVLHRKEGGFFHVMNTEGYVMADSGCPTCELWFHCVQISGAMADAKDGIHYHTEDEIIVITGGEMLVGKQPRTRGTALAVDANTLYGFGCSEKGLSFVNFRPSEPWFGKPGIEPYSEKGMMLEMVRKTKAGIPMDWSNAHAAG
jgi:hypothetical protein